MTKARDGQKNHEYKKGLWTVEEDKILMDYVRVHGKGQWNRIAKKTGLKRCGKSCRLRWMNYLSPNVKRGNFTEQEEDLIIRLHKLLGNRWSLIAKRVPGRTDNQVKNYWNTYLSKKLGIKDPSNGRGGESSITYSTMETCSKVFDHRKPETNNCHDVIPSADRSFEDERSREATLMDKNEKSRSNKAMDQPASTTVAADDRSGAFPNSLSWMHEDDHYELSSLTMMDFVDGYLF